MKTVVIIGAGASRAEAISGGGNRKQRPPLDTDFFSISGLHGLDAHREIVADFVRDHFRIELFVHPRPRMEEIFGLVYTSTAGALSPKGSKEVFSSLCRIYSTVIANTTNWLSPSRKGPLCRLLHGTVVDGPTTVITFNQDILVEKALRVLNAKDSPVSWFPDTGYSVKFSEFSTPAGKTGTGSMFYLSALGLKSRPVVLKPHGSLNWYAKTPRADRAPAQLRKNQPIHCTRRLTLATNMTYTQETDSGLGRKTWYTWPIIVPPIFEKGSFLGEALEDVWIAARAALVGVIVKSGVQGLNQAAA